MRKRLNSDGETNPPYDKPTRVSVPGRWGGSAPTAKCHKTGQSMSNDVDPSPKKKPSSRNRKTLRNAAARGKPHGEAIVYAETAEKLTTALRHLTANSDEVG